MPLGLLTLSFRLTGSLALALDRITRRGCPQVTGLLAAWIITHLHYDPSRDDLAVSLDSKNGSNSPSLHYDSGNQTQIQPTTQRGDRNKS